MGKLVQDLNLEPRVLREFNCRWAICYQTLNSLLDTGCFQSTKEKKRKEVMKLEFMRCFWFLRRLGGWSRKLLKHKKIFQHLIFKFWAALVWPGARNRRPRGV